MGSKSAAREGDYQYGESTAIGTHGLDLCLLVIFADESEDLDLGVPRDEDREHRPEAVQIHHNGVARELRDDEADGTGAYKADGHELQRAKLVREVAAGQIKDGRCDAENGHQQTELSVGEAGRGLECDIVAGICVDNGEAEALYTSQRLGSGHKLGHA